MANENDLEDLNQPKKKELEPSDLEGVVGGTHKPDSIVFTGGTEVDG